MALILLFSLILFTNWCSRIHPPKMAVNGPRDFGKHSTSVCVLSTETHSIPAPTDLLCDLYTVL